MRPRSTIAPPSSHAVREEFEQLEHSCERYHELRGRSRPPRSRARRRGSPFRDLAEVAVAQLVLCLASRLDAAFALRDPARRDPVHQLALESEHVTAAHAALSELRFGSADEHVLRRTLSLWLPIALATLDDLLQSVYLDALRSELCKLGIVLDAHNIIAA